MYNINSRKNGGKICTSLNLQIVPNFGARYACSLEEHLWLLS